MKKILNRSGFTLVEIIIAMGMMIAIAYTMMNMNSNMRSELKSTENSAEIFHVTNLISKLISDEVVCVNSIKTAFVTELKDRTHLPTAMDSINLVSIVKSNASIFKMGDQYGANKKYRIDKLSISGCESKMDKNEFDLRINTYILLCNFKVQYSYVSGKNRNQVVEKSIPLITTWVRDWANKFSFSGCSETLILQTNIVNNSGKGSGVNEIPKTVEVPKSSDNEADQIIAIQKAVEMACLATGGQLNAGSCLYPEY